MHRTVQTLKRWAAAFPGTPMPADIDAMKPSQNVLLRERDPELFALFNGTAPAELEAAVLDGTFPPEPPVNVREEQIAKQRKVAEKIIAQYGNPFEEQQVRDEEGRFTGEYRAPNVTGQLMLQELWPEKAIELRQQAERNVEIAAAKAQAAELLGEAEEARQKAEQAEAAAAALSPAG